MLRMLLALVALSVSPMSLAVDTSEACKPEKLSALKSVDFNTAFAAADKRAHAWHADVVVVRLANTALGPVDPDARSTNWYMIWFSPSARKRIAILIANGGITCREDAISPGRVPVLKSGVYTDLLKMLILASEKGGGRLMQNGAQPMVELSAGSETVGYRGLWFVNYRATDGRSLQVTFDGGTGKFEKAISN